LLGGDITQELDARVKVLPEIKRETAVTKKRSLRGAEEKKPGVGDPMLGNRPSGTRT